MRKLTRILFTTTLAAAFIMATRLSHAVTYGYRPSSMTDTTTTDTTQTIDEYDTFSKKLGVKFKGTEDLKLLEEVSSWLGTPYKYAYSTKGKGTDCSGFVSQVFMNTYDIKLARSSSLIGSNVNKVDRKDLECGDILFFANSKGHIYHVGIYLGDNIFIHSATTKNVGVKTETLALDYYRHHYYMAGRVKPLDTRAPISSLPNDTIRSNVTR